MLLPPDKATGHRPATDRAADQPTYEPDTLTSVKDETIAMLKEQLEAERQAHAEARRLLLSALEKIPSAIEAPSETQGSPPAPEAE